MDIQSPLLTGLTQEIKRTSQIPLHMNTAATQQFRSNQIKIQGKPPATNSTANTHLTITQEQATRETDRNPAPSLTGEDNI